MNFGILLQRNSLSSPFQYTEVRYFSRNGLLINFPFKFKGLFRGHKEIWTW